MPKEAQIPFPGSDEAVAQGCTCPVLDNNHGRGASWYKEEAVFWWDEDCPLHNIKVKWQRSRNGKRIG